MPITYIGSASDPADNGSHTDASQCTITPPSNMMRGDLVVIISQINTVLTESQLEPYIFETGGQTWNEFHGARATDTINGPFIATRWHWCRFNGTWTADPTITMDQSLGNALSAVMHVFRPSAFARLWGKESQSTGSFAAPVYDPFDVTTRNVTLPGVATTNASTVQIAAWYNDDDHTWGSLSPTLHWAVAGSAQYRNLSSTDQCSTFARKIKTSATAAIDVTKRMNIPPPNPTDGMYDIVTFYEYEAGVKIIGSTKIIGAVKIV